jgi:hypothetical protein
MKLGLESTVGATLGITGPNTGTYNGYFIYSDYLESSALFGLFEFRLSFMTFENGEGIVAVSRSLPVRTFFDGCLLCVCTVCAMHELRVNRWGDSFGRQPHPIAMARASTSHSLEFAHMLRPARNPA